MGAGLASVTGQYLGVPDSLPNLWVQVWRLEQCHRPVPVGATLTSKAGGAGVASVTGQYLWVQVCHLEQCDKPVAGRGSSTAG